MNKYKTIRREKLDWFIEQSMDVQLSLFNHYLSVLKIVANSLLECEVEQLAGFKHGRGYSHSRYGINPGSITIGAQKIKIDVPRVMEKQSRKFVSLSMYQKLKKLPHQEQQMVDSVLHGLSMRDYGKVTDKLTETFGLSPGRLSKEFKQRSLEKLQEFISRRFEEKDFVALFIDGKSLSSQQMIIVMGITSQGRKEVLTIVQSHTENALVCAQMLQDLINRGLNCAGGLLVVIDGAKGIRKAVNDVFGDKAIVQRCRVHKIENVTKYLTPAEKKTFKNKLLHAYSMEDYDDAQAALFEIGEELKTRNLEAYNSLQEGMDETLTLQKIHVNEKFARSFGSTNIIESLNSMIGKYTRNVKRWTNSEQRYRWVISAVIEAEQRMSKIINAAKLNELKKAIKKHIKFVKEPELNFN